MLKSDYLPNKYFLKCRCTKEIKSRISEDSKDPMCKDIMEAQNHPAFLEDSFLEAVAACDCNMRYDAM